MRRMVTCGQWIVALFQDCVRLPPHPHSLEPATELLLVMCGAFICYHWLAESKRRLRAATVDGLGGLGKWSS